MGISARRGARERGSICWQVGQKMMRLLAVWLLVFACLNASEAASLEEEEASLAQLQEQLRSTRMEMTESLMALARAREAEALRITTGISGEEVVLLDEGVLMGADPKKPAEKKDEKKADATKADAKKADAKADAKKPAEKKEEKKAAAEDKKAKEAVKKVAKAAAKEKKETDEKITDDAKARVAKADGKKAKVQAKAAATVEKAEQKAENEKNKEKLKKDEVEAAAAKKKADLAKNKMIASTKKAQKAEFVAAGVKPKKVAG